MKNSEITIFVVEDDASIRFGLEEVLRSEGFEVASCDDGGEAIQGISEALPEFIVLDVMLPNRSGYEIATELRKRGCRVPILMLTALGGTKDKVSGFNSGADDYLTKPFDLEELQARVKALLRRSDRAPVGSSNHNEILSYGPLTLVPERFEAIWFDSPVRLTHLEFDLLHCLLQRHGQTVAPSLILKEVWGYEPDDDIETIRVHVRHLRTKLEPDPRKPRFIKTVYGAGYCLELPTGGQLDGLQDAVAMAREERNLQQGDRASA